MQTVALSEYLIKRLKCGIFCVTKGEIMKQISRHQFIADMKEAERERKFMELVRQLDEEQLMELRDLMIELLKQQGDATGV